MKYLLDSNIIIDLLLDRSPAVQWFEQVHEKDIVICPVNHAEVLTGCRNASDWEEASSFMNEIPMLNLELNDFISAAKIRQIHHLKIVDALLASLAIRYDLAFLTRNTKDFNPVVHKFVKIPYKLT